MLPIETNDDRPSPSRFAMLITAIPSAPDCDMKAMRPSGGEAWANVPLSATAGSVLITPMQFGPIIRIPVDLQTSTSSRCSARPSSPVSANPAEITTSAPTPFSAHSLATPSTSAAGTTTNARSTSPGTSRMLGYAATPCTAARDRVDGIDDAGERLGEEVAKQAAADRGRVPRGADDRDRARFEHPPHGVRRRDPLPLLVLLGRLVRDRRRELDVDVARARTDA